MEGSRVRLVHRKKKLFHISAAVCKEKETVTVELERNRYDTFTFKNDINV